MLIRIADFGDYDYETVVDSVIVYWCGFAFWCISMNKSFLKNSVMRCCVSLESQCKLWLPSSEDFLQFTHQYIQLFEISRASLVDQMVKNLPEKVQEIWV